MVRAVALASRSEQDVPAADSVEIGFAFRMKSDSFVDANPSVFGDVLATEQAMGPVARVTNTAAAQVPGLDPDKFGQPHPRTIHLSSRIHTDQNRAPSEFCQAVIPLLT